MSDDLKEARVEQVTYWVAHCPYCDAEHDVEPCDTGIIECVCGEKFTWQTLD